MRYLVTTAATLLLVTSVEAQEPPPPHQQPQPVQSPSTAHRHLGFALRLDAGLGYAGATSASDITSDGVAGSFGLLVGGAVAENLILAGDLWGTGILGSSSMMGGDTRYGIGAVGLNVTYYFMPVNVYVSVSPSIATLSAMSHGTGASRTTDPGFGVKLGVGKEWWVGDHWGLGVAGQFLAAWNKESGAAGTTWTTVAGGLAFTATYN